jgi:putative hydrolase of the HAD superfamily
VSTPLAICFDLDNTLLDPSGTPEALRRACELIALERPELDAAELLAANAAAYQTYWPAVEQDWTLGRIDAWAVSREAWRRTLLACGCDDEALAGRAFDIFTPEATRVLRLFDDVASVLEESGLTVPLALITNGASAVQRHKLKTLAIEHRFEAVIISSEVGVAKPDVEVFRLMLDKLGRQPGEVWHVGDSLDSDVGGALAAGLTAVWINRGGAAAPAGAPRPHHELRSLRELLPLMGLSG